MISHEVFLTKPPVGLSTDGSTVTGRSTSTSVSLFVRRFYSDVHSQHLRIIKYNCTAVRLYGCTTVRLYGCTTVQLYDCTTVRPSLTKRINRTAAENAAFLSVRVSTWFFFFQVQWFGFFLVALLSVVMSGSEECKVLNQQMCTGNNRNKNE